MEAIRHSAPELVLIDGDNLFEYLKELKLGVTEKIIKDYDVNEEWLRQF